MTTLVDTNILLDIATNPLLTRDARRYKTYFPELALIAPKGGKPA